MQRKEIVLPITDPETEWIAGRPVRKMSPTRDHSRLQAELSAALVPWSRGRGEVGSEWRFRVEPAGEQRRPLVPDLAFVSFERLRGLTTAEIQAPALAPNVAIEILSPVDDTRDVSSKVDAFLRAGSELVVIVDPKRRTMTLHDRGETRMLSSEDSLRHSALPGFVLDVGELFSTALDRPSEFI